MSNQVHLSDSLIRIQKAKICSSLLNRIRLIQGSTNLNYNEPHFVESKDNFDQTKDIIKSIKEDLKKGCSELIRKCEQHATSFHSETNSSLTGKGKKLKKRLVQKTNSDKTADKEVLKQLKSKNFGEGSEVLSIVKLSHIFANNANEQGLPLASTASINNTKSTSNRRKKRKRKRGVVESNSSLTLSQSKCDDIAKASHGDIGSAKVKPRKIRVRSSRKRVCSGDESDVEDCSSSTATVQADINQNQLKPRRKLRPKQPNKAALGKSEQGDVPDINAMVSSTIERLNIVKDNVQKVIDESLSSSESSQRLSMSSVHTMTSPLHNTSTLDASVSSLNWSTATMTNNLSQISVMTQKPSQTERVPTKRTIKKLSNTRTMKHPIPQDIQLITPPPTATSLSSTSEQISTKLDEVAMKLVKKKIKQHQQQGDNHKIREEIENALVAEKEISEKRKRSTKVKEIMLPDPVHSARKAANRKKKSKKRDHVNFNEVPEVVPDKLFVPGPVPSPEWKPCLKSMKNRIKEATPSPETLASTTKAIQEENTGSAANKTKLASTRRVNSAKVYRNIQKKSPAKVKSAGNLNQENKEPISVRSVLENEAKNLKELQKQRKSRSRSRSGSASRAASTSGKKDSSRSRHIMEIYQKVRSNTNSCIASINEQMSCTLQEGLAHLNDICGKVRTTLTDMEKDEETYQKLKSKKSFDVSSEGGSVHDVLTAQTSKVHTPPSTAEDVEIPIEKTVTVPHTYTILTESRPDMGQLIHTISMGDNEMVEETEQKPISPRRKKRKSTKDKKPSSSSKSNRVPSGTTLKAKVAPTNSSSTIKANPVRIPIWQRTPPSIIEEIQLTVKKQATKSQYREFLRALKNIARKQRSQVHIMPKDYRETMEKQHDKVFGSDSAKQTHLQASNRKRKEDAAPRKPCHNCSTDACNCGIVVENPLSAPSQHRMHWMHIRTDSKKVIQAYDILDEITIKDLEPIQSEYPRKDHICDSDANKRIEETLLYKLLYHEDPKVLESLLRSTPSALEHNKAVARLSVAQSNEKQKSASNAYKLYEQLEFNVDKPQTNHLSTAKATVCIAMPDIAKSKLKERSRPLHSCSREFNDEVNIPFDLKPKRSKRKLFAKVIRSDNDRTTSLCQKRIEDKLKIIGKKSSIKSISKRIKGGKYSRENIKAKLRNYAGDSKLKMKKILTVLPVTVVTEGKRLRKCKIDKVQISSKAVKDQQNIAKQADLQISEENKDKIMNMSKREIVQILKPYIFHELQPPVIIAMPIVPKYNHQAKQQKQDYQNRTPTFKRVSSFLKDHDEDCRNGRKLCRRCQMSMQSGDETKKSDSVTSKRSEPLTPRQLWKNKYRPTPAENLIKKVLNKNASRRKFEAVPPDEKPSNRNMMINRKELNKSATNTRNKLKQVKNIMQSHQTFLGKDLDDIIDTLEFRIVDALSNPKNQRTDAFNEIEHEIKNILQTISELKELNKENILKTGDKFKSKTGISLNGANEETENDGTKSNTDTNLLDKKIRFAISEASATKIWQNPMVNEKVPTQKQSDNLQIIEEMKDNELEDTYCNLDKDIQKVIEGLDAIITLDEQNAEVKNSTRQQQAGVQVEMKDNALSLKEECGAFECEQAISSFCQQVDEVMKTIGEMDQPRVSSEIAETDVEEKRSDEYLTPFMKAVKDYRQNDAAQSFIDFLDKLTMISKDTVSLQIYPNLPVYTATIQHNAKIIEMSRTYNQAIQYEELTLEKGVGTAPSYVQLLTPLAERFVTSNDGILTTNQWIQTDECEMAFYTSLSRDELIQSVSTPDVEEYLRNAQYDDSIKSIYDKRTQTPSDTNHCCFVETRVEECQVSSDLLLRTSIAVGDPDCYARIEVSTAECQALTSDDWLTDQDPNSPLEPRITIDKINSTDTVEMEKYASSRLGSTLGMDLSDVSIDEYPRNIYTESHISRDRYEQVADSLLCEKRNSYPITKIPQNKSDIISLFENRKSCSRDFLDEGFNKCSLDSYDSMLARYASSVNPVFSNSSAIMAIHEEQTITPTESPQNNEDNTQNTEKDTFVVKKSVVEDVENDKRHKHLLHSVYGIVFTLVFLGFNLNYSCCN